MQLQLTSTGVLPVQVHDTTLDDIEMLFGRAQRSTRRVTLFGKLKKYVTELRSAGIRGSLIVDGSFVMSCVEGWRREIRQVATLLVC